MCFSDLEKAFDRVLRKVMEWALRKRGLAEVWVLAVMSLYEGSWTKVRVGSGTSEEFGVKVGVYQGSVLSPLIFAIMVDAVTEHARIKLNKILFLHVLLFITMNKILYVDDLVLMSESLEGLKKRFQMHWKAKHLLENLYLRL